MKTGNISVKYLLIFISAFLLLHSSPALAQEFEPPRHYQFDTAGDYTFYLPEVVKGMEWMRNNPRTTAVEKRQKTEDFIIKWIYGSPSVYVVLEQYAMRLSTRNADLLVSFLFGYAKYQIDHPTEKNLIPANLQGIEYLLKDYEDNQKTFKRDVLIERALDLRNQGKLAEWVESQVGQKKW